MSGIIHFASGKQLEITEGEFRNISPKLSGKGIKVQRTMAGHLLPCSTMEMIEHIPEPVVEPSKTQEEEDANDMEWANVQPIPTTEAFGQVVVEKPKKKTADELLAEMTAKSNCKHEPEKLELYIQHTAKGVRYFPVCSFCGKRERYVSESKINKGEYEGTVNGRWTDADIANAQPWIEK